MRPADRLSPSSGGGVLLPLPLPDRPTNSFAARPNSALRTAVIWVALEAYGAQ